MYFEVLSDWERYSQFVAHQEINVDAYVEGVLADAWGDQLTLEAMCSSLNISAVVFEFTQNSQFVHTVGNTDSEFCIYLMLDNRSEIMAHYAALIPNVDCAMRSNTTETTAERTCSEVVDKAKREQRNLSFNKSYCNTCKRRFNNTVAYKIHSREVHGDSKLTECQSPVGLQCTPNIEHVNETVGQYESIGRTVICESTWPTDRGTQNLPNAVTSPVECQFKIPDYRSRHKEQCLSCWKFFVNLTKHVKCSG